MRFSDHRTIFLQLLVGLLLVAARGAGAQPGEPCAELAQQDFSDVPDAPAQIVRATRAADGDQHETCRVRGYIAPRIEFELLLPVGGWNGKLLHKGCGGFCGSLAHLSACEGPAAQGYACIVSDMGHASTATDAKWGYNDLQAEFDFSFRATYVTTVIGRAITSRYYRSAIKRAYFDGCSTGGRQALMAAQRFPEQFDGIIVGAPAVSESGGGVPGIWAMRTLARAGDPGRSVLSAADVQRLHAAVLARCDQLDGLEDGILNDPRDCRFDPAELSCGAAGPSNCWNAEQVEAARRLYDGPRDSRGRRLAPGGLMPGSESNWVPAYVAKDGALGYFGPFMADLLRYLSFAEDPGPAFTLDQFDFDRDPQRFLSLAQLFYASYNPNLRRARDHGTKIIQYHGWSDQSIWPGISTDYYDLATTSMGGRKATQEFYRLFMVPGMNHCRGGVGATEIDYLTALDSWVEMGEAPASLLGTHRVDGVVKFQRPVFPYPARAKYLSGRDPDAATSFVIEPGTKKRRADPSD
ncbi:MAG: tannase/feruloyl esterase family alpha/beta hydrolase [Steroidobacteraceae bacterium]